MTYAESFLLLLVFGQILTLACTFLVSKKNMELEERIERLEIRR